MTAEEIGIVVSAMKERKAVGEDGIPNECLKHIVEGMGVRLACLFNVCLRMGVFPRNWKRAKVVWLPKGLSLIHI